MKQKILIYIVLILISGLILGLNACAQISSPTSLVVNYDLTKIDRDLKPGDSGTLIIVIQNTGGLPAKDVEASISYPPQGISASVKSNLGTINPGASVTVRTLVTISDNVKPDTYLLSLKLSFTSESYNYAGMLKDEDVTSEWQIPVTVYGTPNFQLSVEKTEFYKDIASNLIIKGVAKGDLRNLDSRLSGDCVTVIGSEKKYVGDLEANRNFILNYTIKPNTAGTCSIDVSLNYFDNSGKSSSEATRIGLSVLEPDADIKILDVSFGTPSPGDVIELKIKVKNVGVIPAEGMTASLDLSSPFVPVRTSELYAGPIGENEEKEIIFLISVNPEAEIKAYKILLAIDYKIGGVEYSEKKDIGVDISGRVNLEVISVAIERDKLRIEVANTGTRTANAVKATLTAGDLTKISYKDKLSPTKQTTFSFDVPKEKTGKLVLEYTGSGNTRVSISEDIPIPSGGLLSTSSDTQSTGFPLWAAAAIVIILAVVIYKFRKQF